METLYPDGGENVAIDPVAVAAIIGGGRKVAYRVNLALALGSATAGLWLSQLLFWIDTAQSERDDKRRWDGEWVCWPQADVTAQTALSRREADTARRDLCATGVLHEKKMGSQMGVWYRVDKAKLCQLLRAYLDKTGRGAVEEVVRFAQPNLAKNAKLDGEKRQPALTKTPSEHGEKRQLPIEDARVEEQSEDQTTYQKEQQQTDPPAPMPPAPVSEVPAAASLNKNADLNERELVALVVALGIAQTDAASIVGAALENEGGAEVVERNARWWPESGRAAGARSVGAMFRRCVENDWEKTDSDKKDAKRNEGAQQVAQRRYVQVPADFAKSASPAPTNGNMAKLGEIVAQVANKRDTGASSQLTQDELDAIFASLTSCAKERLHKEAVESAKTNAAFMEREIKEVPIDVPDTARGAAARLVISARNNILRQRAASPIMVNGKAFYDADDARAAQIDLDFN